MSRKCQHNCEEQHLAEVTPLNAGRPCGSHPVIPTAVPTRPLAVHPQHAHNLVSGTPVRFEPIMVAPSMDGLTCGVTQNVFTVQALVPSQQQSVSHVLLPVVGSQWQYGWVMQPETTWITQSVAPQRPGLCHPSQASCCQHPGQLGSLYPAEDLGRTSKSREEAQREVNQPSRTGNIGIAPEQRSDQGNKQSTPHSRPDFAEILNKVMINTSGKLMELLEEELDRMDDEDDEFSDLEEMDTEESGLANNNPNYKAGHLEHHMRASSARL